MADNAQVNIWGKNAGTIAWNRNRQVAAFEFSKDFDRELWNISPIMMPHGLRRTYSFSSSDTETFDGLPGLFADSLPDAYGRALLEKWLQRSGRTETNPIERLCYQGRRGMGALEYIPTIGNELDQISKIEIDGLVKTASEALSAKRELKTNLSDDEQAILEIIRVGTSAGGQRAKAVIAYNKETEEVMSGQVDAPEGFEHWLIKLDGVKNGTLGEGETRQYGRIEYAYYKMAQSCGIDMTECMLKEENGKAHFMTKRFDRIGCKEKIHMQTLCGIAHYDYKLWHAYSYEQAFSVMRRLRLGYDEQEQMYRRMVFNVIARNQDDHTKNISFLMNQKGVWHLSPAYDVTWSYNPTGRWTSQHQMSINNKWENVDRTDLEAFADNVGIKRCDEIIDQVKNGVSHWMEIADKCGLNEERAERIKSTLLL